MARSVRDLDVAALDLRGHQHVLQHGAPGQQHRRLEHHAHVAARPGVPPARPASTVPRLARSRPARMRSSVLLPQPLGPTTVDELALAHIEADVAQGNHIAAVLRAKGLVQSVEAEGRRLHLRGVHGMFMRAPVPGFLLDGLDEDRRDRAGRRPAQVQMVMRWCFTRESLMGHSEARHVRAVPRAGVDQRDRHAGLGHRTHHFVRG